jgi:hypothetical protein
MPNPLLLQVLRRAILSQHRDPRMPECMKPGLRNPKSLEKWVEHTLEDIIT